MNPDVQEALETTTEILQNPTEILSIEPSRIDAALQSLIQTGINCTLMPLWISKPFLLKWE